MIRKRSVREEVLESRNPLLEALSLETKGFIERCDREVVGSQRGPGVKKSNPGGAEAGNERFHEEM